MTPAKKTGRKINADATTFATPGRVRIPAIGTNIYHEEHPTSSP